MNMNTINLETEIRKIPRHYVSHLGNILEIENGWKDIMGLIPGAPWVPETALPNEDNYPKKYTHQDIELVSDECSRDGRTGFDVLVDEWGTSGKVRPKVTDIINLLNKAGFERASSYLQGIFVEDKLTPILSNMDSIKFEYSDLLTAIHDRREIGEGGFGSVYLGNLKISGEFKAVAIKVLKDPEDSQNFLFHEKLFVNEIRILSQCSHKNIITLEGYSHHRHNLALVYTFVENGSLYDRLSLANDTAPLPWKLRLKIALGIAEALVYLHTRFSPPMIHRDIKSPNILLDTNFIPKVGDFGIVHVGGRGISASTVVRTKEPIGTSMYMAPEADRGGDVSVKTDTFSYAVVILELLTGLNYYDEDREDPDLLTHVMEFEENVTQLLDAKAGQWDKNVAEEMFKFAAKCYASEKRKRPDMVDALALLNEILSQTNLDD